MAFAGAESSHYFQRPPWLIRSGARADAHSDAIGHPGLVDRLIGSHPMVSDPQPVNRRWQAKDLGKLPDIAQPAAVNLHLPQAVRPVEEKAHGLL
jgi:hypothetical protein